MKLFHPSQSIPQGTKVLVGSSDGSFYFGKTCSVYDTNTSVVHVSLTKNGKNIDISFRHAVGYSKKIDEVRYYLSHVSEEEPTSVDPDIAPEVEAKVKELKEALKEGKTVLDPDGDKVLNILWTWGKYVYVCLDQNTNDYDVSDIGVLDYTHFTVEDSPKLPNLNERIWIVEFSKAIDTWFVPTGYFYSGSAYQ